MEERAKIHEESGEEKSSLDGQNTVIRLENVWKIYQMGDVQVPALRGIDLEVEKGEFLTIAGASGSGKSTMMNLIGCLDLPSKGKIFLGGDDIADFSESQLAQIRGQKIGFVFQQFNLIPTLTALENVMLPLEFQNVDTPTARESAFTLLNLVGLGDRVHHLPSQLSGGQQQRVAISRALAVDPEIILADEPTGNLDSKTGAFVMDFFSEIHRKESKTVIIVTHDFYLVKRAERVVYLKDGEIERIEHNHKKEGGGLA